jgi:hypothetical protein
MGFKLRGAIRCGRCGKPRGIRHTCVTTRTRKRRHSVQNPVTWECSTCHKPRGLNHTCVIRTDFKKRRRAAARKRTTAERRKRRQLTAAKRKLRRQLAAADRRARDKARKPAPKRKPRPRGDSHEPGTCGNPDCPKYGCKAYFEGMHNCTRPHCAGGCD